jgi:hypothetical protein
MGSWWRGWWWRMNHMYQNTLVFTTQTSLLMFIHLCARNRDMLRIFVWLIDGILGKRDLCPWKIRFSFWNSTNSFCGMCGLCTQFPIALSVLWYFHSAGKYCTATPHVSVGNITDRRFVEKDFPFRSNYSSSLNVLLRYT